VKAKSLYTLLITLFLLPLFVKAQSSEEQKTIVSVERIWDRAAHNAFTSLINYKGKLYCTFRESNGHVSEINGSIRVIVSDDEQNWRSIAFLSEKDVDLRDPQLSVTPDGRIMLNFGGSYYVGETLVKMKPKVSFSDENGMNFSEPQDIVLDDKLHSGKDWLWKATWHQGTVYAGIYQPVKNGTQVVLAKSSNGINYQYVTRFDIPRSANETVLRFDDAGKMIAVVRCAGGSGNGYIGISAPPYTKWQWNELSEQLGGPDLIILPNKKLLCGTRLYQLGVSDQMVLSKVSVSGNYIKLVTLPSGGDCSYPGMVILNNKLYVSYYSSHEEKTAIYLARLWLDRVESLTENEPVPEPVITFNKNGRVELSCSDPEAEIRYSLDGSTPAKHSPLYQDPIKVTHTTELRVKSFKGDQPASRTLFTVIGTDVMQPAQRIMDTPRPGLNYSYYEGEVSAVREIELLPLKKSSVIPNFSLEPKDRDINFAFTYKGYIEIPKDGLYTFYLASNDGSKFYIDGFGLINNDGGHGEIERSASASLKKGFHKIALKYFQMGGQRSLRVFWKGPGFDKTEIPPSVLFR